MRSSRASGSVRSADSGISSSSGLGADISGFGESNDTSSDNRTPFAGKASGIFVIESGTVVAGSKVGFVGRGWELRTAELEGLGPLRSISSSTGGSCPGERVARSVFATSDDNEIFSSSSAGNMGVESSGFFSGGIEDGESIFLDPERDPLSSFLPDNTTGEDGVEESCLLGSEPPNFDAISFTPDGLDSLSGEVGVVGVDMARVRSCPASAWCEFRRGESKAA